MNKIADKKTIDIYNNYNYYIQNNVNNTPSNSSRLDNFILSTNNIRIKSYVCICTQVNN